MDEVREEINDIAEAIPGYSLGTVLIGYNPILGRDVEWSARNFFRGAAGLLPGGTKLFDRLNEGGALDATFDWIESQISQYDLTWSRVKKLWSLAWDRMGITEGISGNVRIFKNSFSGFFSDVGSFVKAVAAKLIEILRELAVTAVKALFGENSPAYDMIVMILGSDPLTGELIEWSTVTFLRNALLFFGFETHLAKMEETGKLQEAADWLDTQFQILHSAVSGLASGVSEIWNSLGLDTLADPSGIFSKTVSTLTTFVGKLLTFVGNVAIKVLELIKAALIALLKPHLNSIPGYPLFTVVLGKDPITGEVVERTPHNFIRGFLSFVPGGLKTYDNLQKSGAIDRAYNWLIATITELGLSPTAIAERFTTLWNSFSIDDLMNPLPAFERVGSALLSFVTSVLSLVARVGLKILEFIFVGVMGESGARVVAALKQGKATFKTIIKDPVGFLGNLIKALGKGFNQFGKNIWQHLKAGLVGWLFGALAGAGLQLPEKFDLKGIFSLVAQILGLTYQKIRVKLVKRLGEKQVARLEKAFDFLKLFLKEGFAGIWRKFLEWMGNLKETVMGAIKDWIVTKIVTIAVQKLATMTNPVGAVIEAILAIYNMVMFFIERMQQILAVVESVIQSISNIANGKLQDAANYVEQTMARTLPVIISFLARLIGLGGISEKIKKVIGKIQKKVSKAVDKLLDWIMKKGKALLGKGGKPNKKQVAKLPPEERKASAITEFKASIKKSNGVMERAQMDHLLGTLKDKWQLSKARVEGEGEAAEARFYASPHAAVPLALHESTSAAVQAEAKADTADPVNNYIKPISFGTAKPSPRRQLVDQYNALIGSRQSLSGATFGTIANADLSLSTNDDSDKRVAISVEARTNTANPPGGGRAGTGETLFGYYGADEQRIKTGKNVENGWEGGHLIGDQLIGAAVPRSATYEDWNLAPQVGAFNNPVYKAVEDGLASGIRGSGSTSPVVTSQISVNLSYSSKTYTITAGHLITSQIFTNQGIRDRMIREAPRHQEIWNTPLRLTTRIPSGWNATFEVISSSDGNLNQLQPNNVGTDKKKITGQDKSTAVRNRTQTVPKKQVKLRIESERELPGGGAQRTTRLPGDTRNNRLIEQQHHKKIKIVARQPDFGKSSRAPIPKTTSPFPPQGQPSRRKIAAKGPTAASRSEEPETSSSIQQSKTNTKTTQTRDQDTAMKTRSHLPRSQRRVQRYRNENAFFGNEGPNHDPFFSPSSSNEKRQEKGAFLKSSEEEEAQTKSKSEEEEAQTKFKGEEEEAQTKGKEEEEETVQAKCDCGCESKSPEDDKSKRGFPDTKGGDAPGADTSAKNAKDCDETKSALISAARSSAKSLAAKAVGASAFVKNYGGIDLGTGPSPAEQHYSRWFGEHTPRRAAFVANSFNRIAKALNGKIHFDCGCKKDIYAYVYSGGRKKIYLCKKFWNQAGSSGFDSKPGVIIHELAHEVRSAIGDKGYGTSVAEGLAKKSPNKAIRNADNYEYYAESL